LFADRVVGLLGNVTIEERGFQCRQGAGGIGRCCFVGGEPEIPAANEEESTLAPRIFPAAKAREKFMRPKSAEELTHVSAFIE